LDVTVFGILVVVVAAGGWCAFVSVVVVPVPKKELNIKFRK
jgi:hypothetical protein